MKKITYLFIGLMLFNFHNSFASENETVFDDTIKVKESEKLVVLWTSGDAEVAIKMVFMYTFNAKKYNWWKDITFIIWGPSSKLLSENAELQEYIKKMKEQGIILEACKACTDMYKVSEKLSKLGVDVKYMGVALTEYIKNGRHVITF